MQRRGEPCLLPEGARELLHEEEVLLVDAAAQHMVKVLLQLDTQGLRDAVRPAE